jgi:ABC-type uncharacterized transport system substrate-binding protein
MSTTARWPRLPRARHGVLPCVAARRAVSAAAAVAGWLLRAVLWALLALPASGVAQSPAVAIYLSATGRSYSELLEALQTELRKSSGLRAVVGVSGTQSIDELLLGIAQTGSQPVLLVTVGGEAARQGLEHPDLRVPLLSTLVPRSTFSALQAAARTVHARRASAIYLDQPLNRQVELIRLLLPAATRVGVVVGPDTEREIERIKDAVEARGFTLVLERSATEAELYPALQRTLGHTDVFLAVPDARVINAETAQNLLLTSFRFRVPVIGYSAAYVRAGALAAAYSSPAQIGTEAGEVARSVARGNPLGAPRYPRYFSVAVNRQIARLLDIAVEEDAVLRERLQRQERE